MYTIYKHTSPSGKIYIGVTQQNPKDRWKNGCGYIDNEYFTRAIKKYGWVNISHEILFTGLTKEEAEQKEIELIAYYKSNNRDFGYNIENGGSLNGKHSEYTRLKISNALKGARNPRYGKKFPNQVYRKRMEATGKISMSEKERMNRSLSHKNQTPINKRVVEQYDKNGNFIRLFESISEASKYTKVTLANISRCASGERKTAGGYIWKFNDSTNMESVV